MKGRERLFELVLALYPRRYRARFGDELRGLYREAAGQGGAEASRLLADLLRSLPGTCLDHARLHHLPRRRTPDSAHRIEEATVLDSLER
ncbi:MAG: hypothetical protein AAF725_14120, partial [Acidobacteriota bacterium]